MPRAPALEKLPGLPVDADGPVFQAPWEAQAFALTLKLHEAGCFSWREWAAALAAEIDAAQAAGDPDLGDTYYLHWLAALEAIVAEKQVLSGRELRQRRDDWAAAARNTPHGEAIMLEAAARRPC